MKKKCSVMHVKEKDGAVLSNINEALFICLCVSKNIRKWKKNKQRNENDAHKRRSSPLFYILLSFNPKVPCVRNEGSITVCAGGEKRLPNGGTAPGMQRVCA